MKYKIYAALHEESNAGWVWLKNANLKSRTVVKLNNPSSHKSVFFECRIIDKNFVRLYKERQHTLKIQGQEDCSPLVISDWFRDATGPGEPGHEVELEVSPTRCPIWGTIRAGCHPPDPAARRSTQPGALSS